MLTGFRKTLLPDLAERRCSGLQASKTYLEHRAGLLLALDQTSHTLIGSNLLQKEARHAQRAASDRSAASCRAKP
jgi:hypothetical protein